LIALHPRILPELSEKERFATPAIIVNATLQPDDRNNPTSQEAHEPKPSGDSPLEAASRYIPGMHLLVVEDDAPTARLIRNGLLADGYSVQIAATAEAARVAASTEAFDLAIVDIGLPGADGFCLLRCWRRDRHAMPVLMLTARDGLRDRVTALDEGADDYLVKPIHPAELSARCRALIRRSHGASVDSIQIGGLHMHLASRMISVDSRATNLTRSEWTLLEILALNRGQVVDKDRLRSALSKDGDEPQAHAVETHVSRLRKKLGDSVSLVTLRGFGYRLDEPRRR
jgi:DNA-binding response OmpR family regulator